MQKQRAAGVSIKNEDPREKEHNDILAMLDFPQQLETEMLRTVNPQTWKNVGPSVCHAVAIMVAQQTTTGKNFLHLKQLLDRFVKKTMTFIKNNDQEILLMKNKVTRDLQTQDRLAEQKQKGFKTTMDNEIQKLEQKVDQTIMNIDRKMETIDEKLAGVEDTAIVMERVGTLISNAKEELEENIKNKYTETDGRIKRIYTDELWYDGKFGPNSKGPEGQDPQYPKMRDFIIKNLEVADQKHGKLIAIQRSDHNETDKQMKKLRTQINNQITKQIETLEELTKKHSDDIEEMNQVREKRDVYLDEYIGNSMTKIRKIEEDIKESDLMKHNGILHTLKVKIENLKTVVEDDKKRSTELLEEQRKGFLTEMTTGLTGLDKKQMSMKMEIENKIKQMQLKLDAKQTQVAAAKPAADKKDRSPKLKSPAKEKKEIEETSTPTPVATRRAPPRKQRQEREKTPTPTPELVEPEETEEDKKKRFDLLNKVKEKDKSTRSLRPKPAPKVKFEKKEEPVTPKAETPKAKTPERQITPNKTPDSTPITNVTNQVTQQVTQQIIQKVDAIKPLEDKELKDVITRLRQQNLMLKKVSESTAKDIIELKQQLLDVDAKNTLAREEGYAEALQLIRHLQENKMDKGVGGQAEFKPMMPQRSMEKLTAPPVPLEVGFSAGGMDKMKPPNQKMSPRGK